MLPAARYSRSGLACLRVVDGRWRSPAPPERRVSLDLVDFYHNESQLFGVDTLKRDLTAYGPHFGRAASGFDVGRLSAADDLGDYL